MGELPWGEASLEVPVLVDVSLSQAQGPNCHIPKQSSAQPIGMPQ